MASLIFRPACSGDEPFLVELFASTRGDPAFLDPPLRTQMLQMQYRAQQVGYAAQFPESEHLVIVSEGDRAGRIWIAREHAAIRIVDVSVLPQYRRRGIASAAYRRVIA